MSESIETSAEKAEEAAQCPPEKLTMGIKLAYGLPNFAGSAMAIPISIHMTKFYADTVGVALGLIALAQVVARALDAITDPLMGWISDRTNTRWGRRRPWIMVGAPLCAVAVVALFTPPRDMDSLTAAIWFTCCFAGYFLFHTIYAIPHYGLGPELTLDYNERSSLFAWRDGIAMVGIATASIMPAYVIKWYKDGGLAQAESERLVFMWFSVVMAILLILLYYWMCYRVKENPTFYQRKSNPLVPGVRRVLRNRPFKILLACYLVSCITASAPVMMPFYIQYTLGVTNWVEWMGIALVCTNGIGLFSLPIWIKIARRFGKKGTWLMVYILGATSSLALFFLPSFIAGEAAMTWMTLLLLLAGIAGAANGFIAPSMQADVIDYDELYTGKRREAQYGALWSIVTKFAVIPSSALPLSILASIGFQPNVEQTELVKMTIRILYALVPATFAFLAILLAVRFPISKSNHRDILEGIAAHNKGQSATDPLTGNKVPVPDSQGLDEDTGWFLDHFSFGELRRAVQNGASSLVRDSVLAMVVSVGGCLAAIYWFITGIHDLGTAPGFSTALAVLALGIGLTAVCFHGIRLRAARRAGGLNERDIQTHLRINERF